MSFFCKFLRHGCALKRDNNDSNTSTRKMKNEFESIKKQSSIAQHGEIGNLLQNGFCVTYLSQEIQSKIIKLNIYNLLTKTQYKPIEIEAEEYNINIANSVYCYHPKTHSIYLINKNKQLFKIENSKFKFLHNLQALKSINTKFVITYTFRNIFGLHIPNDIVNIIQKYHGVYYITSNNIKINPICYKHVHKKSMSFVVCGDKLMILGAIKPRHTDNEILYIPYDKIVYKNKKIILRRDFPNKNVSIFDDDNNDILVIGGNEKLKTNMIWKCHLKSNGHKWSQYPNTLPDTISSFGVLQIKSERYRYILLFGGTNLNGYSDKIYALFFAKDHEKSSVFDGQSRLKTVKRRRDKKQVTDYDLNEYWFQLLSPLPEKANYHVFYDENVDQDRIHLITHNGTHYTLKYQELMQMLVPENIVRKDNNGRIQNGTCRRLFPWTDMICWN